MHSIENNMLSRVSLSQYLNDFFSSYLSISRKDRERILFQDIFEELNTAIRKNSIIRFTSTSAPKVIFTVQPYCIAASKEEQCNYLLCLDNETGIPRSFRISRIRALYSSSDKSFRMKAENWSSRKLPEEVLNPHPKELKPKSA